MGLVRLSKSERCGLLDAALRLGADTDCGSDNLVANLVQCY